MRLPLSVNLAFAYGAGLATGLARFPAPLAATVLILPLLIARNRCRAAIIAVAVVLGVTGAALARHDDTRSCAALLPAGGLTLPLRAEEPIDSGGVGTRASMPGSGCGGAIAVRWPKSLRLPAGMEMRATGEWRPRPGRFGRAGGVLVVSRVADVTDRARVSDRIRTAVHVTARRLYGRRGPLVDALVLGRRADLDRELLEEFAGAGLMHLLAISGFHLGLLVGWIFLLLRMAGLGRTRAAIAGACFAVAYTAFLGWPAPAARAASLTVILGVERARQRMPRWDALLGTTALLVLLVDPWAVLGVGAWLSLGALWGAVNFSAWAEHRLGGGGLVRALATSAGATFATAPITAFALGTVALIGIALNLLAVPLAALVVPAVVASLLLGSALPAFAAPLATGAGLGLGLLQEAARWGAAVPGGHLVVPEGASAAAPWVVVLGALLWIMHRTTRGEAARRLAWCATAALWGWLLVGTLSAVRRHPDEGSELALHFLDVGQGDAAAIRTPHGHWVLVDGGPLGTSFDAGRSVVLPFLRRHGVRRLDAVILSHAHADHLGGLPSVLDRIPAGEVIDPAVASGDPLYAGFLAQLDELDEPWMRARRGDHFTVDSVTFRVLHPDTSWAEWGQDLNENSLVLLVEFRGFRALLAGDAGLPAESTMVGRVGPVTVLKVGHHGSRGATGVRWLRELQPDVAVISVGRGNRYGHPAPEALGRLRSAGVEVFRTDQDGGIDIDTDGTTLTIHSRRGVATRTVSEP